MSEIKTRLATSEDGDAVHGLLVQNGSTYAGQDIDWSDIVPYWLVAEREGKVVGALQTCPGKPMGRIEMLVMDASLSQRERAITYREMVNASLSVLRGMGAQIVAVLVPDAMQEYRKFLEGRDCAAWESGTLMVRRL